MKRVLRQLKKPSRETLLFSGRIRFAIGGMVLLIGVLMARLVYLQVINHDHYTTLSQENRLKVLPLPPTRGLIYSADGVVLADNRPSFSLEVIPEKVRSIERAVAELQPFVSISPEQLARFRTEAKQRRRFDPVSLRDNLTEQEVAVFSANRHRFPGFSVAGRLSRHYPLGARTVSAVGYVGRINEEELKRLDASDYSATTHVGKEGVERSFEHELHGTVGYEQVEVNAEGRILRVVESKPPVEGRDLHLTIDSRLQQEAVRQLEGQRGAIVAMDPNSGAVLAFVSAPTFDPNEFVNGISTAAYAELRNAPERPLFNRALQGLYPPGSTIKPIMVAGAVESGMRDRNASAFCPGWMQLPGSEHKYRCWLKTGHGSVDAIRAVAESCDVYFYALARDMGIDRMQELLRGFGLGAPTGIDLPGEAGGLVPSREWKKRARKLPWFPGETLVNGIGQGFMLSTPLQLAYAAAIFANRGKAVTPHVVESFGSALSPVREPLVQAPRTPAPVSKKAAWDLSIEGMHAVVQAPTGTAAASGAGAKYQYAGKTGTAQLFNIAQDTTIKNQDVHKLLRDHALFIAFAPLDQPRLALGIVVENGESGAHTAAPIARELFDFFFALEAQAGAAG